MIGFAPANRENLHRMHVDDVIASVVVIIQFDPEQIFHDFGDMSSADNVFVSWVNRLEPHSGFVSSLDRRFPLGKSLFRGGRRFGFLQIRIPFELIVIVRPTAWLRQSKSVFFRPTHWEYVRMFSCAQPCVFFHFLLLQSRLLFFSSRTFVLVVIVDLDKEKYIVKYFDYRRRREPRPVRRHDRLQFHSHLKFVSRMLHLVIKQLSRLLVTLRTRFRHLFPLLVRVHLHYRTRRL